MNLLIISGGRHPYEESTPVLDRFLKGAGHEVTVNWDSIVLGDAKEMGRYDALIFNTLRNNETALTKDEQAGMTEFIRGGKGFVCIHISGSIPDTWPEYRDITGGGWVMGTSFHPPYGQFTVNIQNSNHPGVAGISDFLTNDELYMGIVYSDNNDVFMSADFKEGTHQWGGNPKHMPAGTFPLGWTRSYGDGKVFVTLLGHNGPSFETQEFQKLVLNGIEWATS
ncbi:MAG: ThuA domain-containing protein [Chloroflexi bacterium]|nr:ThuA domain-containing protein [Chloroflexota bacterium]